MGIGDQIRGRRGEVTLSAQRLFTNRRGEVAAFLAKAERVRTGRRSNPDLNLDVRTPRRNLLAFYGQGGIGKSRLSEECQRLFTSGDAGKDMIRAAIRLDFSEPSARDAELFLLKLRAGMVPVARSFPAFDTCLTLYWGRRHPGTSISEFVRHQSLLGGSVDREALAENLRDFMVQLVDGVGGPVVGGARRVAALTLDVIRRHRMMQNLLRDCPYMEACVQEEDLDELRLHLPLLLGWDLSRLQRDRDVEVTVFLDTFEHVSHGHRRARLRDLEDAIARCVFFLPSVLFVVSSRNRLDWAEEERRATLEFAGPGDWPGLTPTGGDQFRIGALSEADCDGHLAGCLLDADGNAAIPEHLRRPISRMSAGLPLYLDVAANHYRNLLARGSIPIVDDFVRGLPEIVLRLMEDLSGDEADLLRAAALLGVFDRDTLRVALPDILSSSIEHFLDRSFVVPRDQETYAVHEMLQTSIRLQDTATTDAWSASEWEAVENRLVAHWSRQHQDPDSRVWKDRRTQALAFWQLVSLYATTSADADAVTDIIMQVQVRGAWTTIDTARNQPEALLTGRGRAFLLVLDGMMHRQIGHLDQAEEALSRALESPELTQGVRRLAMYYLGETRDVRVGDPEPLFRDIARTDDRLGTEARMALAHSLARRQDLIAALELAESLTISEDDPEFAYRYYELLGVIWWSAGRMSDSAAAFERSRQVALAHNSPLLLALATRHLGLASCWNSPHTALTVIDEAEALNRDLGLKPGIGQCQMTRATALVGTAPPAEVDDLLQQSTKTFTSAGYLDDALGPLAVAVFAAAVDGHAALAERRRHHLRQVARGRRPRHWLAAADVWTGHREEAFNRVTWPQGPDQAWNDWAAILNRRRATPST